MLGGLLTVVAVVKVVLNAYDNQDTAAPALTTTATAPTPTSPDGSGGKTTQSPAVPSADQPAADEPPIDASSVVTILTPVMAAIIGVIGFYFGFSAEGSAKGVQADAAQTQAQATQTQAQASKIQAEATKTQAEAQHVDSFVELQKLKADEPPG